MLTAHAYGSAAAEYANMLQNRARTSATATAEHMRHVQVSTQRCALQGPAQTCPPRRALASYLR